MTKPFASDYDLHLLAEGRHFRTWEKLGAHPTEVSGESGVHFAVWAPNAELVSVVGDFNEWNPDSHLLTLRPEAGVWEGFVPGIGHGALYKYRVASRLNGYTVDKTDPYGFAAELRPATASKVWDLQSYGWEDQAWMESRRSRQSLNAPVSIYEVHLGSWMRVPEEGHRWLTYRELAQRLADYVYAEHPDVLMIAEESTSWPMVSRPTYLAGLGFGLKWNMGWMHDMLDYMARDSVFRSFHHDRITFSMLYAFSENFLLPFSHDEVVHGKGSMPRKMPGDDWQRFANLRLLYAYMFGHPGKKLLFMGLEFGQWSEWNHDSSLDWHLLDEAPHAGLKRLVRDLNTLYRGHPALHEVDFDPSGFEWVDCNDNQRSAVSFLRRGRDPRCVLLIVCNFTPVPRPNYRVGVPTAGFWEERLNTDAALYGGSGQGNVGGVESNPLPVHGRPHSLNITLPPLAVVMFQPAGQVTSS